jgi:hypothetical protein
MDKIPYIKMLLFLSQKQLDPKRIAQEEKRDEVTGDWRKLHNEELHNLYFSPNIIRMIKSRRMRWAGHVARMGRRRNACKILWKARWKTKT